MRTPRVTVDLSPHRGQLLHLPRAEARHLASVLRRRPGDPVEVLPLTGGIWTAVIAAIDGENVALRIEDELQPGPEHGGKPRLQLGIAVVRGAAFDLALRMATELGVDSVAPLFTERTVVRWESGRKLERVERIAREAAKQCGRASPLVIEEPASLEGWLSRVGAEPSWRLILDPRGGAFSWAGVTVGPGAELAVAIGPEGGFTTGELAEAHAAGWSSWALPTPVLRTPTAVAAVAALGLLLGSRGGG